MARDFRKEVKANLDWIVVEEDESGGEFKSTEAMNRAWAEMSRNGKTFGFSSAQFGDPFTELADHPELNAVDDWLSVAGQPVVEVAVILWLSRGVRAEWSFLPKRTPKEHRELYERIERLSGELEAAIEQTGQRYVRGGGWGLACASIPDLMTESETAVFGKALGGDAGALHSTEMAEALPRFDDLLGRIRKAANRLKLQGPLHSQPTKRGAERGYFVRRMHELLTQRYGAAPHEVLAAIATVALDEVTDRELVAKLLR